MKKFLWAWAIAGVLVPASLLVISRLPGVRLEPSEPGKVSGSQKAFEAALPILYPAFLAEEFLSLVAMDSGKDSPAVSVIIIAVSFALNAGCYVLVGLLIWKTMQVLRLRRRGVPT